jgi:hypothetical protein
MFFEEINTLSQKSIRIVYSLVRKHAIKKGDGGRFFVSSGDETKNRPPSPNLSPNLSPSIC